MAEVATQHPDPDPPSREPRRSDSRRNRDRVLDAAVRVLAADPGATVEDVAREAGLTRSTVYRRFRSRDDLLTTVRARIVEENRALLRDAVAREPDVGRCMDAVFADAVRLAHTHRRIWQRLVEVGAVPRPEDYAPDTFFVEWLAAGQRSGDLRADVPVEWLVMVWVQLVAAGVGAVGRGGIDIDEAARLAADAAARALRPG